MNSNCWRNSRLHGDNDDEKMWPKLSPPALQAIQNRQTEAGSSKSNDLNLSVLEYPTIEEIILKRKHSFVASYQLEIHEDISDARRPWRRTRLSKRVDLIPLDLQKALEKQRWPLILQTERTTKIISKTKISPISIVKKKNPSRIKWLKETMIRRQYNESRQQINVIDANQETKSDIPAINFDQLKINIVSHDKPELVNKMLRLSCFDTNYRNTSEINISEDTVTSRPDLLEKMESLSLEKIGNFDTYDRDNDANIDTMESIIDCEIMDATLRLRVCDETGECSENVTIKQEPGTIKFSKKFREYCTNTLTPDLKKRLQELLAEISRLQKKMYERNVVKGRSRRRYYAGIKEVQKHIELKKIKFVVIAPDLDKEKLEGGLDDTLSKLIGTCKRYEVPYCFGLGRRKLGYYIHGKGFVSCIGIANYSGADEQLKNVLFEVVETRNEFIRLVGDEAGTIDVHKLLPQEELLLSEVINFYLKILATNS